MTVTLRQRLIHAAITSVTLGTVFALGSVACSPVDAPPAKIPSQHPVTVVPQTPVKIIPAPCDALALVKPYDVRYEDGTVVHVPLSEATEGDQDACAALLRQALKDGQTIPQS